MFNFPFELAQKWEAMSDMINQAFAHAEPIGSMVLKQEYDLIGPPGEIIMPQIWETVLEPEWMVTMHMWPIPKPPRDENAVVPPQCHPSGSSGTMPGRRVAKAPSPETSKRMRGRYMRPSPPPTPPYPSPAPGGPGWIERPPGGSACLDLS